MNSLLYFMINKEKTEFKIGITDDIEERYLRLASVWGEMDLAASRLLQGDRREVAGLEKTLHFLLKRWQIKKPDKLEGRSEWFSMECFGKAMEIIELAAKLRDCSLEGRLSHGISLSSHINRDRSLREKPPVEVVAKFEEIEKRWPAYKSGTLQFKEHPRDLDAWLWIVDIGGASVRDFMALFWFQNSRSAISLAPEAYFVKGSPSIVQACISKNSLALLAKHEEYKDCHDFIAGEIHSLLSEKRQNISFFTNHLAQENGFQLKPNPDDPATVPMPWEVIVAKMDGDYTERDRKLYAFLIHAAWDDLETVCFHKLSIAKINRVFRELGGDSSPQWIWESARRLSRTSVDWQQAKNGRYPTLGIANLLASASMDVEAQDSGNLQFEIPAALIPILKNPGRLTHLRIHFMLGLSGKYAVTLYEILESVVNMRNPVLEVDLSTLRQWLKVEDGKMERYADVRRLLLEPALQQINDNPEGAGFSVAMKPIKSGRAVERLRFSLAKTSFRMEVEDKIQRDKSKPKPPPGTALALRTATYEQAKKAAPRLDVYYLETEWREWAGRQKSATTNPDASFVAFCKKKHRQSLGLA